MLKTHQREIPYIGIFKTAAGEEFIGKVLEETMLSYSVKNPLCMVATQNGFQFAPFIMMADPELAINVPKPVITAIPAPKLQEQYEQAISPIQLLKK
jgi:uncharacterized protein (DUF1499 family)